MPDQAHVKADHPTRALAALFAGVLPYEPLVAGAGSSAADSVLAIVIHNARSRAW
jgi:hypothetical protein